MATDAKWDDIRPRFERFVIGHTSYSEVAEKIGTGKASISYWMSGSRVPCRMALRVIRQEIERHDGGNVPGGTGHDAED